MKTTMTTSKLRPGSLASALVALFLAVGTHAGCGDDDDQPRGNPSGVGNVCARDSDCETGKCFLRRAFGYCTKSCDREGDTAECPPDSVCKPIQGGERRCLLVCGSQTACASLDSCRPDYCPDGSSCVGVSNTDVLACEPEPM